VPVIAVGGMEDPAAADEALRAGRCDLCAVGRSLLTDAALPTKIAAGHAADIVECAKCNECHATLRRHEPVECLQWERDEVAPFVLA
jgi:2,4-dienoyl-CoA reductase (NADPH2)